MESRDWARVVLLALARAPQKGATAEELSLVVPATPAEVAAAAEGEPEVAKLGNLYAPTEGVQAARERLFEALEKRTRERPESPELSVAEARSATGLDVRLADALLAVLGGEAEILTAETGISLPNTEKVPPELEKETGELLETLRRAGVEPPVTEATPAVRLLLKRGEVVQLTDGLYASKEVEETVLEEIKTVCREEGKISLAGFRDLLHTSRKYAQAWLEYSDSAGVTSRRGDAWVLTRLYR